MLVEKSSSASPKHKPASPRLDMPDPDARISAGSARRPHIPFMRILILSPYLPTPSQGGGGTTYFYYIKNLAAHHEIHLMCLDRQAADGATNMLAPYCRYLHIEPLSKPGAYLNSLLAVFSSRPFRLAYYRSAKFGDLVRKHLAGEKFDVIIASHERMGQYAFPGDGRKRVIDLHDVVSDRHRMLARATHNPLLRLFHNWEARRLSRFETECLERFDSVWISTAAEGEKLRSRDTGHRVRVTLRGIDLNDFAYGTEAGESQDLLFTGHMSYEPNVDAMIYYCREIHARVKRLLPSARVYVVGNYPHRKVIAAAREQADIVVTGRVPSIAAYLRRVRVFIAPLRIGTGARIKLMEAMAVGIPIVSTTVGCEGLGVKHEEHLLIADTPDDFARAVRRLFDDPELGRRLSVNARRLVEEKYDLNQAAAQIESILRELVTHKEVPE